eukprot:5799249-Amphidinium_carterae.1
MVRISSSQAFSCLLCNSGTLFQLKRAPGGTPAESSSKRCCRHAMSQHQLSAKQGFRGQRLAKSVQQSHLRLIVQSSKDCHIHYTAHNADPFASLMVSMGNFAAIRQG